MIHGIYVFQGLLHGGGVAHVPDLQFYIRRQIGRPLLLRAMHLRGQIV